MAYIRKIQRKKGAGYRIEISQRDGSKRSKVFRTKEEALSWGRSQDDVKFAERHSGLVRVRMSLDVYFAKWFEEYAKHHHSPGWQTTDLSMYRLHVKPILGQRMLHEIHSTDIQRTLGAIRDKGQAASSANRVRQLLSKMFTEAVKTYQYLSFNPVVAVRPYKETPKQFEYLREDEAKKLMEWADTQPLGIALHLVLHLGLREGEIVGLKWDAVDLPLKYVNVRRKWQKKTKVLEEFGKGKKIRTIGIPQQGILDRLRIQRNRFPQSEFVVCTGQGKMVSPIGLDCFLKAGIAATGVRRITVHGLRHTFASLYMQKGGDLYDLQKLMGHSDVRTTERYRHSDPEYLRSRCKIVDLYGHSAEIPPKIEKSEITQLRLVKI